MMALGASREPPGEPGRRHRVVRCIEEAALRHLRDPRTRGRRADRQRPTGSDPPDQRGHLHAQNSDKDIQKGGPITLVEGSTGAGGLDNLARGTSTPPVEFSVESVAANCEFTKITRFQVTNIAPGVTTNLTTAALPQVNASTRYLNPQHLAETRLCDTNLGLSSPAGL